MSKALFLKRDFYNTGESVHELLVAQTDLWSFNDIIPGHSGN